MLQILNGGTQDRRVFLKVADALIAVGAQQPTDASAGVVVIDGELPAINAWAPTDGALAVLRQQHQGVLLYGQPIGALKSLPTPTLSISFVVLPMLRT